MRKRRDELCSLFRDHGFRLTGLADPLAAASVGASLSAPFVSIGDLQGRPRDQAFDAIVATGDPAVRAGLLALAVATDGELEALAVRAAGRMDGADPPWVAKARSPLKLLSTDRLLDQHDGGRSALVVAFGQGSRRACFFMRFHPDSLLTESIIYLPETDRNSLVAEIASGRGPAAPYRFSRRLEQTETQASMVSLVGALLEQNDWNLRRGRPLYPPALRELSRISDVVVVPAILVLLRKFVASAYGIGRWTDVDPHATAWL
ncbi:hypothetical protein KOI35_20975 [Actinoplanes bogorensis]|uniref:Uncharacterized protein n=1 Tax=Paractinoplanes bogorensis TaxID=1610840 RepID=A0ABS5YTH7_9ACTN|nr:hypothetical protein [Actinoplanes bogorensis]MBU2665989.1 hypothetical protein [Actinoplanes bogorensis]